MTRTVKKLMYVYSGLIIAGALVLVSAALVESHQAETLKMLEGIAAAENIEVRYVSADTMVDVHAAGCQDGLPSRGMYVYSKTGKARIFILVPQAAPHLTLAHELGHHYGITLYSDEDEPIAWEIGYHLLEHGTIDGYED